MGERDCPITRIDVGAYTVPTDAPEADGRSEETLVGRGVERSGRAEADVQ